MYHNFTTKNRKTCYVSPRIDKPNLNKQIIYHKEKQRIKNMKLNIIKPCHQRYKYDNYLNKLKSSIKHYCTWR